MSSGEDDRSAEFEARRDHLRAVAYRMLGSLNDAEDAVQEAWLRLDGADVSEVKNLTGWLTTVVSRICLDMLRTRGSRREEPLEHRLTEVATGEREGDDPEREAVLADSVGRALLVVLDTLTPAERIALVLHDMFAVPFDEIAPIVERSQPATKKLASRARHRVRGSTAVSSAELARHRRVVDAFLAAIRAGDLDGLLAVLDPDVVRRADAAALRPGMAARIQGARKVAEESVLLASRSRLAEPALVDGALGIVVAPRGRLLVALTLTVDDDRIVAYDVIAEPARLRDLNLAVLDF